MSNHKPLIAPVPDPQMQLFGEVLWHIYHSHTETNVLKFTQKINAFPD